MLSYSMILGTNIKPQYELITIVVIPKHYNV